MLTVAGIIRILTASPVKDFLISCGASASWDGAKKIASQFKKDSIQSQMWGLLSDTMAQFYEQVFNEYGKQLEFDEGVVITSFFEQYARNKNILTENSLRRVVEETIYGEMDVLTDREYRLWISIFADNCSKYPDIYQMYRIQDDISSNIFTERNLMFQMIEAKLGRFIGNENHTDGLFQESIDNLYDLFDSSWKKEMLTLINNLPENHLNQEKIIEKIDLIDANEDCELILSVFKDLFSLHNLAKAPYEVVQKIKDCFHYPHFNKVLIVTGTAGAGKTFFIKEFIETAISKMEENDISIIPCIIDISQIKHFQNFEDFVIDELNSFIGKKLETIGETNMFFEDLQAKVCFVIDDVNSQILKKKDWDKLIQGIKKFSRFESFRWILSVDEYEYYYLEWDNSFLEKYCIAQMSITERESSEIDMFRNAFSIDQYNKDNSIVEWILTSQYGMDEQLFSSDILFGITTPKEAHYFGEAAPKEEVIGMPSTYYEYINKIVYWKSTALAQQNADGIEEDLRDIITFVITHHICELDGLNLSAIDLFPLRRVQLVSPSFMKSTSMFDLDQGIIKTSYRINILPFWAAKMTKMIDINNLQNVGELVSFPKELSEWLIPCIIFLNFETCTKKDDELFDFFRVLNEQCILHYALFCANRASIVFSKKLFEYFIENAQCYIQEARDCYSVLYFVYYSQLKMVEKLQLLNTIAEFIPQFSFEILYERIYCSIIYASEKEKNLKKNVLEVALCQIGAMNYINGSNAGAKYMDLALEQGKELEMIVWDIVNYIRSHPKLLSTIATKEGKNESFMDFFIRRCFEKYLFIKNDSILHVYQRLEDIFILKAPVGSYVKRNLTCAAGNVFVNSKDREYRKNYILLSRTFAKKNNLYQRLTALFLITNSVDEKKPNLNEQLALVLLKLSHDKEISSKYGAKIENLLKTKKYVLTE